jgi:hypothetical protein
MRRTLWIFTLALLGTVAPRAAAADLTPEALDSLHKLILPDNDESQYLHVAWQSATNIWAARQKAAAEGKPILLWFMAGEPLGSC